MKLHSILLGAALVLGSNLSAQGQVLRGKIEDNPTTQTFFLSCTKLPLTSTVLNLNSLVGQQLEMTVTQLPSGSLNVLTAAPIAKVFDMGNLRLGRADRWQITGSPGEAAGMFLTAFDLTGYLPLGAAGTWLLGPTWLTIATGQINPLGLLEVSFQPPNVPQLVGTTWTAQGARMSTTKGAYFANSDCKVLQQN